MTVSLSSKCPFNFVEHFYQANQNPEELHALFDNVLKNSDILSKELRSIDDQLKTTRPKSESEREFLLTQIFSKWAIRKSIDESEKTKIFNIILSLNIFNETLEKTFLKACYNVVGKTLDSIEESVKASKVSIEKADPQNLLRITHAFYDCPEGLKQTSYYQEIALALDEGIKNYASSDSDSNLLLKLISINPSEEIKITLIKIAVSEKSEFISKNIDQFNIKSESALIELAKEIAVLNPLALMEWMGNFKITCERALIEIGKLTLSQPIPMDNQMAIFRKFRTAFKVKEERDLVDFLKILAKINLYTSQFIDKFTIQNIESRLEIAKISAKHFPHMAANYIQKYQLPEGLKLLEVACILASQEGNSFLSNIDKFVDKISDVDDGALLKLIKNAIQSSPTAVLSANVSSKILQELLNEHSFLSLSAIGFAFFKEGTARIANDNNPLTIEEIKGKTENKTLRTLQLRVDEEMKKNNFLSSQETEAIIERIRKYRNARQLAFLYGYFISNSSDRMFCEAIRELAQDKKIKNLLTPRILPSIIPSKWIAQSQNLTIEHEVQSIKDFFQKARELLKNNESLLLPTFLRACIQLDKMFFVSPDRKIKLLAYACKEQTIENVSKALSFIDYFCSCNEEDILNNLPIENLLKSFSDIFNRRLLEHFSDLDINEKELTRMYEHTFGTTRIPLALEKYKSCIKDTTDDVHESLNRFVRSVMFGTYNDDRFRTDINNHLELIESKCPQIFSSWKNLVFQSPIQQDDENEANVNMSQKAKTVQFTTNWQDLFLCGTEVTGSCQRIDGDPSVNKCLMAYCLDGKNGMIAVKNEANATIARSMLRLLWDDSNQQAVLFLDKLYSYASCTPSEKMAMMSAAEECAKILGCKLFKFSESHSNYSIQSLGSSCPYEYADGAEPRGLTKGSFSINQAVLVSVI